MKTFKNTKTGKVVRAEKINANQHAIYVQDFSSAVDSAWFMENYKPVTRRKLNG
jgi:hypothetical protein